jgi:FixJ family two-component response regulator
MPDQPTVHVVEDEPIIATTLAIILNAAGFEAIAFNPARIAYEQPSPIHPRY